MKADYVNPFVKSTASVLNQFAPELSIERNAPSTVDPPYQTHGVTSYLGLTGRLSGQIIYDMNLETARNVAGAMNGEASHEMDDLGRSALRELTNMISGNAVTVLKANGVSGELDITPPSLILGEDSTITNHQSKPFVQVPLRTDFGDVFLNLSLSDTE